MKKSKVEKYLHQKKVSILEIASYLLLATGAIIFAFINNGGPIGLPIVLVGLVILCIARSLKIPDSIFDTKLSELLSKNELCIDDNTITAYDFTRNMVRGLDNKARSRFYCITKVDFRQDAIVLDVYYIDIVSENISKQHYEVSKTHSISCEKTMWHTSYGYENICTLSCDIFDKPIPVSADDVHASKLIDKICSYEKN